MERASLEVHVREERGTQLARRLRQQGIVPAVVYKGGKDNLSLKLSEKEFLKTIGTKAGTNVIITLKIDGAKTKKDKTVIIKEIQKDPLKGRILHIDFNEISLTETLKVQVKVEPKGEPIGVKEGGTLERIMREVDVECLPTEIPAKLEIDVSALKINDSVYVKDIAAPKGVKILQDPSLIVMSIKPPFVEKVAEPVPGEAAAEEPELIRKKKEAEEGAEEGEAKEEGKKEEGKKEAAPKKEAPKEEKK